MALLARKARLERIAIDHGHNRSRSSAPTLEDRADSPGWGIAEGDSTKPGSPPGRPPIMAHKRILFHSAAREKILRFAFRMSYKLAVM